MYLVKPSIKFEWMTVDPLLVIERAGRLCYKSEERIRPGSAEVLISKLLEKGHESIIEHAVMSYRVVCDRGITHEYVRHRIFSYAQESTRYCDYQGGVQFILPPWIALPEGEYKLSESGSFTFDGAEVDIGITTKVEEVWLYSLLNSERDYVILRVEGWEPQKARSVLPHAVKTELIATANFRSWRNFFKLRTSLKAHPQMQEVANAILADAKRRVEVVFDDL